MITSRKWVSFWFAFLVFNLYVGLLSAAVSGSVFQPVILLCTSFAVFGCAWFFMYGFIGFLAPTLDDPGNSLIIVRSSDD